MPTTKRLHTFVAYVEDKPGVLNRVASLFRRRNFNIESLTVGKTNRPGVSRMTILVEASPEKATRIEANLYKLVNVLRVDDLTDESAVQREMVMVKVKADAQTRSEIIQIANIFRANIIDVATHSLILELMGTTEKVSRLMRILEPFGIVEVQSTGVVGMARGIEGVSPNPPHIDAVADEEESGMMDKLGAIEGILSSK